MKKHFPAHSAHILTFFGLNADIPVADRVKPAQGCRETGSPGV